MVIHTTHIFSSQKLSVLCKYCRSPISIIYVKDYIDDPVTSIVCYDGIDRRLDTNYFLSNLGWLPSSYRLLSFSSPSLKGKEDISSLVTTQASSSQHQTVMNNKEKRQAVEALRNQFKKTGKYQNWRHQSLDTSSDILDFSTNNNVLRTHQKKVNTETSF